MRMTVRLLERLVRESINRSLHEETDDNPLRDVPARVAYVGVVLDRESIDSLQRVASAEMDLKGGWEPTAHQRTTAPSGWERPGES
jgi:hypothetical protein